MSGRERSDDDLLFDLPLDPRAAAEGEPGDDEPWTPDEGASEEDVDRLDQALIEFDPNEGEGDEGEKDEDGLRPIEAGPAAGPMRPRSAGLADRFRAGLIDLAVLAGALLLALGTIYGLEVDLTTDLAPPLALFLASFSFLYTVVPLAFWGNTPGMAYRGIVARGKGGEPLTIRQCVMRWIGWLLTLGTLGLLALVALAGVSVSDLISGSRVWDRHP